MKSYWFMFSVIISSLFSGKAVTVEKKYTIAESKTPIIEVIGNKFFDSESGEQFFIKGIAYQPSRSQEQMDDMHESYETKYIDPLADPETCLRDIPYLKKLHINTIRVYTVAPLKDHNTCMEALSRNGIYVLLDLSEPDVSIVRDNPSWNINILRRYKEVVDAMNKYPNLLGFFAGNEVTNDKTNTDASPFVKAAIRDIKQYMNEKKYRKIPVGYSINDDEDTRKNLADYFTCGDVTADFYGVNMYEWCGYSSYGTSGYRERTIEFENFSIPVFFSEFGCNLVRPRPFTEIGALYSKKMTQVWSGGLVYMFFEEENNYGVVKIDKNDTVKELPDFLFLEEEFGKVTPKGIKKTDYMENHLPKISEKRECPNSIKLENWNANEDLPPTPDDAKCLCLDTILPCLVLPFENSFEYEELFDYICHQVDCTDIIVDGGKGLYGTYSDCTAEQQLSLQISKIYFKSGTKNTICPIDNKNIYFNLESQEGEGLTGGCKKLLLDLKESLNVNSVKTKKRVGDGKDKKEEKKVKP
ncbi:1,3-beta-glucanosyltransferase NDAI_0J01570 [Naumovozyma dairenensis CBS 421]|uniref:1,3-beta-glucanosyltransferase n=1 Tax=Naumovozyma dairenensis (strain ATCC 10597 / BCRC 20456 / CBS 421 / NBRC 0211 / NRRL Y-12639) TaxID=1071378 RepID=G0WGX1_NAUDC|nr:hypothetical protein NDAI_0J01570 [Naumovozyma dairenensis CBS 421]CCD27049.1 hypothetical protein NDAI_0J01570 [Naumovozyma dairenensis CBS 421]